MKWPAIRPGYGPYWYGFYWDYRQRTRSFYVGKQLPRGIEMLPPLPPTLTERMTGAAAHACYGRRPVAACQQARTHSSSLSDRTRSGTPLLITRV
jgi:hypothetical protein